jgi:hypothetical protein
MFRSAIVLSALLSAGLLASASIPAQSATAVPMLPDLTIVQSRLSEYKITTYQGQTLLRFPTAVFNTGDGPIELRGHRVGSNKTMDSTQYIYNSKGGRTKQSLGTFAYYPPLHKWHVLNVADYRLLDQNRQVVSENPKVSYFLEDDDPINLKIPHAKKKRVYKFHASNDVNPNARNIKMGISVGWADTYEGALYGQWLDITGLPHGNYILQVNVNPDHLLIEKSYDNNIVEAPVTI